MIEMLEQGVDIGVRGDPACRDVLIDLAFHRLPSIGPEPALIGRDWQDGLEFDHTILTLDDPDLCPGLVKVHPSAQVGRQSDGPARLHGDEVALHGRSRIAAMQYRCITRPHVHQSQLTGNLARPEGNGRALATYEVPIECRDEWLAAARHLA